MSVRELSKEEKYINEMFDGLELEIQKRRMQTMNRAMIDSLDKQLAALKKAREARLAEWRQKADLVKSE